MPVWVMNQRDLLAPATVTSRAHSLSLHLQHALEWCLVVQEALMWQKWPENLLNYPAFGVALDDRAEVMFRGPR